MTVAMNNERLTVTEMYEKYPDEWLFIIQPKICKNTSQLLSGIVQVHSPSREIIHKVSKDFVGRAAIKFTGEYTDKRRRHSLISYRIKKSK